MGERCCRDAYRVGAQAGTIVHGGVDFQVYKPMTRTGTDVCQRIAQLEAS